MSTFYALEVVDRFARWPHIMYVPHSRGTGTLPPPEFVASVKDCERCDGEGEQVREEGGWSGYGFDCPGCGGSGKVLDQWHRVAEVIDYDEAGRRAFDSLEWQGRHNDMRPGDMVLRLEPLPHFPDHRSRLVRQAAHLPIPERSAPNSQQ